MGRTKSYDRDEVITLALPTFWAVGYHATGVAALEESMGINKFSIYAEFGSKHGLFLATIDHFIDAYLRPAFATIDPQDPEGSILGLLTFAEAMSTESGRNGCFLLNAGIEFNHSDPDISDRISSVYGELDDRLILALRAGEQRGELAPGVDPTSLASLFRTYFEGLMSRARHGGGPGSSGPGMDALRVLFRSGRTT
jgi:TetR/AcrR family transcriptional repressor of nem operon